MTRLLPLIDVIAVVKERGAVVIVFPLASVVVKRSSEPAVETANEVVVVIELEAAANALELAAILKAGNAAIFFFRGDMRNNKRKSIP